MPQQKFVAMITSAAGVIGMTFAMVNVAAQEAGPTAAEPSAEEGYVLAEVVPDEAVEEITVYGEKTVPVIKAQIMRADRKLYGLWNEMNDEREFDVYCRLEGVYASRRKERICLPAFEHGVLEESWNDLSTWTGAGRPEAEIRKKREIMRNKMIEFAQQNPDLHSAIIERATLQRDLDAAESRGDDE
jgi:hypothetical protein